MKLPSDRTRRIVLFSAAPVAVIAAGLLIWQISSAAFTAQTQNVGNNWETGSVLLSDDDLGSASFQVTNVLPGTTGTKCIVVTSKSSVVGEVRMYITRLGAGGLENYIKLDVELGTGGTFNNCTGFVADGVSPPAESLSAGAATHNSYANGVLPWTTTGNATGESKTYRATWTFDTTGLDQAAIDALQGKSASTDVVWELQTN